MLIKNKYSQCRKICFTTILTVPSEYEWCTHISPNSTHFHTKETKREYRRLLSETCSQPVCGVVNVLRSTFLRLAGCSNPWRRLNNFFTNASAIPLGVYFSGLSVRYINMNDFRCTISLPLALDFKRFPGRPDMVFRSHPCQIVALWREVVSIKNSGAGCSRHQGNSEQEEGWSEISVRLNTDASFGPSGSWWPCDLWAGLRVGDQNTAAPKLCINMCVPEPNLVSLGLLNISLF